MGLAHVAPTDILKCPSVRESRAMKQALQWRVSTTEWCSAHTGHWCTRTRFMVLCKLTFHGHEEMGACVSHTGFSVSVSFVSCEDSSMRQTHDFNYREVMCEHLLPHFLIGTVQSSEPLSGTVESSSTWETSSHSSSTHWALARRTVWSSEDTELQRFSNTTS